MSLGEIIRKRRRAARFSQAELGEKVDCSADWVSRCELNKKKPSQKLFVRMWRAFGGAADEAIHIWESYCGDPRDSSAIVADSIHGPSEESSYQSEDRLEAVLQGAVERALEKIRQAPSSLSSEVALIDATLDPHDSPYEQVIENGRKKIRYKGR